MRTSISQLIMPFAFIALFSGCNNRPSGFTTDVAVPVSVEEVTIGSIRKIYQTSGVVVPASEATFRSEMNGRYQLQTNPRTGSTFKMGDQVMQGDVVIRLEDREYENNMNVEGARLDYNLSEMEHQTQKALYEKGGVTLRELVNSERSWIAARNNLENAELSLAKMEIKAPFNGVITGLPYFSPGIRVETGTELLTLMDYQQLVLDLSFPESMLGSVDIGQRVDIMNYTLANDTLSGMVSELSPSIDRSTRTFAGRLMIDNPRRIIRPGMFVKCEIELERSDSTVVVSKELLLGQGNNRWLFVAEQETAHARRVRTGLDTRDEVEILSGIAPGERLIVRGHETLTNRARIKIID